MVLDRRLNSTWWLLRLGLGLGPFLAGLDKFFNLLANWEMYLNPLAPRLLHVSPAVFMRSVGVVEMIVGVAVLTRWTRPAAYIAMAWLLAIAVNLLSMGTFFDVGVRDVEMAIAAYALARLTEVREEAGVHAAEKASARRAESLRGAGIA